MTRRPATCRNRPPHRTLHAGFDKRYDSAANQRRLAEVIPFPVLPTKGKCNAAEQAREHNPRFQRLRRQHAADELAINALDSHGLGRCPDHGTDSFKRYVVLGVVERNLHRLGAILSAEEAKAAVKERRRQRRAA